MKNKNLLTGIGAAIVAVALIGCGGLGTLAKILPPGTINHGGGSSPSIAGTWKTTQITQNNVAVGCPGTVGSGSTAVSCVATLETFTEGSTSGQGTYAITSPTASSGTYVYSSTVLSTSDGVNTTSGTLTFSSDGNTYYWVIGNVIYQATRQ